MKKSVLKSGDKVRVNWKNYGMVEGKLVSKSITKSTTTWRVHVVGHGVIIVGSKNITKIDQ